jgi:hypothetical protein
MTAWRKAQNSRDACIAAGSKLAQGKVVATLPLLAQFREK